MLSEVLMRAADSKDVPVNAKYNEVKYVHPCSRSQTMKTAAPTNQSIKANDRDMQSAK